MLLYFLVPHYPSLFKPYYDAQFASLLEMGHDARVFSMGNLDRGVNEKVREYQLDARTRHYPGSDLRVLARHGPGLMRAFVRNPLARARVAGEIGGSSGKGRERVKHIARMLALPMEAPDLCMVHGVPTMRLFPWLRAMYPGTPIALHYHGGGLWGADADAVFGTADVVFTNTEYSVREAVSLGCPAAKLAILPVGFDLDEYRPPHPRSYRPDGVLRVVSASRFGEEKGHVYALEALALLRGSGFDRFHYTIVGGGRAEMRALLERRIHELGLDDRVEFAGSPATRAVIAALGEADVLLLPSFEYRGIVEMQAACVQEALLMGALAITTRTGGVPESIPEEMRPFSLPCQDAGAIADAIRRIDALSDAEIGRLAERSRAWVTERYDIRQLNERMLREVAARTGGAVAAKDPPAASAGRAQRGPSASSRVR